VTDNKGTKKENFFEQYPEMVLDKKGVQEVD
jgi:hypothetical protein